MLELITNKKPAGDQPKAIDRIVDDLKKNKKSVLLGATGTGKTFTIANVISKLQKKTLIIVQNKTLAGQLQSELKELFPNNRVERFISYFDYYRPESYLPAKDVYVEKTSKVNEQIEMMRHSTLNALATTDDVIVVASVAAIYGTMRPDRYKNNVINLAKGMNLSRADLISSLVRRGYVRSNAGLDLGQFRARGDVIEVALSWTNDYFVRIEFHENTIEAMQNIDIVNGVVIAQIGQISLPLANLNATEREHSQLFLPELRQELKDRLEYFKSENKLLEYQRLEQRITLDIEQIDEYGYTSGLENYSRYVDGRLPGEMPFTLFDFFGNDYITVIDESHVTIPQLHAMYGGDRSRKTNLVEYGFRLPSALDNRPLMFEEFYKKVDKIVYLSATPGDWELDEVGRKYAEQIIRPTGLLDPHVYIKPTSGQMDDILKVIKEIKTRNEKAFITTVTKKMAEEVSSYLTEKGIAATYLHSELKTPERESVIYKLRTHVYDCIVGVNLLREGLDIPEVSFVAIIDADKEGFLRNTRSLIQIIGRAARNINGKVYLYADVETRSIKESIDETNRRRKIQEDYNIKNKITPQTIIKPITKPMFGILDQTSADNVDKVKKLSKSAKAKTIADLKYAMLKASKELNYEEAARLRDIIIELEAE